MRLLVAFLVAFSSTSYAIGAGVGLTGAVAANPTVNVGSALTAPVVESFSSAGAAGLTSVTVVAPTGIQEGDLLVAYHYMDATEVLNTPTGWTAVTAPAQSGHSSMIYYKEATLEDESEANYTFSSTSAEDRAAIILRVSGAVDSITELDFNATTNGTGDLVTSLTPATANSLALTFGSHDDNVDNWDKNPNDTGWTFVVEQMSRTGTSSGAVRGGFWKMDDVSDAQTATYSVNNVEEARYGMIILAAGS